MVREVLFDLFFSPQTFLSSLNSSPINEYSVQSVLFCFDFCPCHNNPRVLFHISLYNLFLKLSLRISKNSLVGLRVVYDNLHIFFFIIKLKKNQDTLLPGNPQNLFALLIKIWLLHIKTN